MIKSFLNSYKINHSSDGKTLYMKVAQNDEKNPNTQPVHLPHIPSIVNTQLFPLRFICPKTRNTGDTFPDVSPFRLYHLLPR